MGRQKTAYFCACKKFVRLCMLYLVKNGIDKILLKKENYYA